MQKDCATAMGTQAAFSITPARVLDARQLPDSFTGLEGKHVWLRTTDLLGVQRTWRGDWRENNKPADLERWNAVPTPPAYTAAQNLPEARSRLELQAANKCVCADRRRLKRFAVHYHVLEQHVLDGVRFVEAL